MKVFHVMFHNIFLTISLFHMFRNFFFHISFFNIRMLKVSSKKQKEPSNELFKVRNVFDLNILIFF